LTGIADAGKLWYLFAGIRVPSFNDHPRLDRSKIAFPSDAISLGTMRRVRPLEFERESLDAASATDIEALAVFRTETLLAEKAFAAELGLPDPSPLFSRREMLDILQDAYVRYGICTGRQHARLSIREIESAAVEQARDGGMPQRK
jgi:hypothetical protein